MTKGQKKALRAFEETIEQVLKDPEVELAIIVFSAKLLPVLYGGRTEVLNQEGNQTEKLVREAMRELVLAVRNDDTWTADNLVMVEEISLQQIAKLDGKRFAEPDLQAIVEQNSLSWLAEERKRLTYTEYLYLVQLVVATARLMKAGWQKQYHQRMVVKAYADLEKWLADVRLVSPTAVTKKGWTTSITVSLTAPP